MQQSNQHTLYILELVTFDVPVNSPDEQVGAQISNGTAEYSQTKTEHQSVSEIKAGLEEARHLSLDMIVVYRIEVYI